MNKLKRFIRTIITQIADDVFIRESKNIDNMRQKKALEQTAAFIEQNLPKTPSFDSRYAIYKHVTALVRDRQGLICEFGVAGGKSINFLARLMPERVRIYGFDTFEGLPEDWYGKYSKGTFKQQALPQVASNVELVCGLFHETLPPFLNGHPETALLIHIDCDLYSSAKTVLDLMNVRLQEGTIVVFDEFFNYPGWQDGEAKAFLEFAEQERLTFEYLGYCKTGPQVAIRILSRGVR